MERQRSRSVAEEALDRIVKQSEEKLNVRKKSRAEARLFRIEEMEKEQLKTLDEKREEEEQEEDEVEISADTVEKSDTCSLSSELESIKKVVMRKNALSDWQNNQILINRVLDLEESQKRLLVIMAQTDNERMALNYENELLKDDIQEKNEDLQQQAHDCRILREKVSTMEKIVESLENGQKHMQDQLQRRDKLLDECGVIVVDEEEIGDSLQFQNDPQSSKITRKPSKLENYLSTKTRKLINTYCGNSRLSLDEKIRKILEQKNSAGLKLPDGQVDKKKSLFDEVNEMTGRENLQTECLSIVAQLEFRLQETETKLREAEKELAKKPKRNSKASNASIPEDQQHKSKNWFGLF